MTAREQLYKLLAEQAELLEQTIREIDAIEPPAEDYEDQPYPLQPGQTVWVRPHEKAVHEIVRNVAQSLLSTARVKNSAGCDLCRQ